MAAVLNQQSQALKGSIGILWDIESCLVPSYVQPEDVSGNIIRALHTHSVGGGGTGAVKVFSCYGDSSTFPRRLRDACRNTGVKLMDVPSCGKNAADKVILVDMLAFALDHPPPSSILLISGDANFAPVLHILGNRGYNVILVIPARVDVSSTLISAGRFVWDWPSLASGKGFVPPLLSTNNSSNYFSTRHLDEETTFGRQNEDAAATAYSTPNRRHYSGEPTQNIASMLSFCPINYQSHCIFEKEFGEEDEENMLLASDEECVYDTPEENIDDDGDDSGNMNIPLSPRESNLLSFKCDLEELLVCYSCCILMDSFEDLYELRYKKALDYQAFGANGLEDLLNKVTDVVVLVDDQDTNTKFIVSRSPSLSLNPKNLQVC